jgi:hypothetical protein
MKYFDAGQIGYSRSEAIWAGTIGLMSWASGVATMFAGLTAWRKGYRQVN